MFKCPNCGLKASGDYCQWCHYPILRGVPKRDRKSKKQEAIAAREKAKQEAAEARERAQREAVEAKEAEVAAREKTKEEAIAAKKKQKQDAIEAKNAKEAEKQAKIEAERTAKEKTKEEAIAAKKKQKQDTIEAKNAKEAEKQAKIEAERTAKEKRRKTEEVGGAELYEGEVKLMIVSPVDLGQMKKLQECLRQIQDLDLVMVSGSVDEGTAIFISAVKPIPLIDILREMSPVEQVVKEGTKIQIMLKAE